MGELEDIKKRIEEEEKQKSAIEKEKEKEEPEKQIELPEEFRSTIVKVTDWTFKVLAKRYGKQWILTEDELKELSNSYIALAQKHLPTMVSRFSIEINAFFWSTYILLKRIA